MVAKEIIPPQDYEGPPTTSGLGSPGPAAFLQTAVLGTSRAGQWPMLPGSETGPDERGRNPGVLAPKSLPQPPAKIRGPGFRKGKEVSRQGKAGQHYL